MEFYAKTLEPIKYRVPKISIAAGVEIPLHNASDVMLEALRKKLQENPKSMLITELGKRFLFSFKGRKDRDDSYWRL